MQLSALDLRKGMLVSYQGQMCTVAHWNILRNDRRLFVQMRLKDIQSGRTSELKEHAETKFDLLDSQTVELSHSYRDGNDEVFFSPEGEEVRCAHDAAEDALRWQADAYVGFFVDGRLLTVSPPKTVVATVVETPPKSGGTGFKDALLDNGVRIKVSQIVAPGDKVRLDPETLEFKERA